MAGKAEIEFRRRYPHARVVQTSPKPYEMFTVYAGDYVCAEGHRIPNTPIQTYLVFN